MASWSFSAVAEAPPPARLACDGDRGGAVEVACGPQATSSRARTTNARFISFSWTLPVGTLERSALVRQVSACKAGAMGRLALVPRRLLRESWTKREVRGARGGHHGAGRN